MHHDRKLGNLVIPIFQQAVNVDLEVYIEAQAHIMAAIYKICTAIVQFQCQLRNNLYFAIGNGKWNAAIQHARTKWVCKE